LSVIVAYSKYWRQVQSLKIHQALKSGYTSPLGLDRSLLGALYSYCRFNWWFLLF